jgi:hypothetical protein
MRGEHTRVRRGPFPFPHTRIRYIERLAVLSKPLSAILAEPSARLLSTSGTRFSVAPYTTCLQQQKGHK